MKPFLLLLTGLISQQINGTTSQQAESLSYNDTVSQSSTATSQDLTANIDFRTAVRLMLENNNAIKAAEKNTELARRQSQLINASWFPTVTMTGTYAMMSNKISVNQEYAPLLDPLKEKYADDFLVPNVLNFISKELGDLSFDVPIIDDDFGTFFLLGHDFYFFYVVAVEKAAVGQLANSIRRTDSKHTAEKQGVKHHFLFGR